MARISAFLSVALALAAAAPGTAFGQIADRTWKVSYVSGGTLELAAAIVQVQTQGGKTTGELVAASPRLPNLKLKSVRQDAKSLRIVLQNGAAELVFEAAAPGATAQKLLGALSFDTTLYPAWLQSTAETILDAKSVARVLSCPPMQQANALSQKSLVLRLQAQKEQNVEKKKMLLQQAVAADQTARQETPKLYREVLAKHGESPSVFEAALRLVRTAQAADASLEEVKSWALASTAAAKSYGPRWHGEVCAQLAAALLTQENVAALGLDYARQAEQSLTPEAPASAQSRALNLLAQALRKQGNDAEAKTVLARLAKLDLELDREYSAKMPGFQGTPFAGRKSKSERAVFMELFTGAACPPCVAADLAFDVLGKTYQPSELVLIQYHVHIPGPDPMTNPDTEARWAYYSKAFPTQVRGVPSSIFNGKPTGGGGGGAAAAKKKYDAYRGIIDPLLEEPSFARLTARARQKGDRIEIEVEVNDLVGPDPLKKLRIILAEETVRYPGPNKIRLHHNVVRAIPGGAAGKSLTAVASKHTVSVDLAELRGRLTKYLDNYEAKVRPFANPARPLDFANLRVIAFVQDDNTRDILQAVQVEVKDK